MQKKFHSPNNIKRTAVEAVKQEYLSIKNLVHAINDDFVAAVLLISESTGRVIITGIGKSANIAQKIVATLNSTGTPSIFMHAADAIHGDLGIIRESDIVIAISKSGESPEIKVLIPLLKIRKNKLIAMVGNIQSYLAKQADIILDTTVDKEACPNNLAPTSSTTAQLVMGDALAVSLLQLRGFTPADFAKFHPGGALGKRMYLRVEDLFLSNLVPRVGVDENIKNVIIEISSKRLGATAVMQADQLVGIITDGDLRRMLEKYDDYGSLKAGDIMTAKPQTIDKDELIVNALSLMRKKNITQLPVTSAGKYEGVLHLHDILNEGIY